MSMNPRRIERRVGASMCSRSMRLGVATTVSRVADGLADVKAAVLET